MQLFTDEQAIAIATLGGCEFFRYESHPDRWYANDASWPDVHPLELEQYKKTDQPHFDSREELAHAFVKWLYATHAARHP